MIMVYLKKVSPVSFCTVLFLAAFLILPYGEPVIEHVQAGSNWIETTQGDFTAGITDNVTATPNGNVTLSFSAQSLEDDFLNESKIASTDNLVVDTISGNVKLKSQPNEVNQTFGGTDVDLGWDVLPTPDGGYIIAAASVSYGPGFYDAWQIKTDSMGLEQWNKTFGGTEKDGSRSIALTNDGGYILGGYADSYGNPGHDFWLVKTDSSGNEDWNRTYGGLSTDASWKPFSTHQTSDGGYIICGYETSFGSDASYDAWVVKTDSLGFSQWDRTFGGLGSEYGNGIQETEDGGFILIGQTTSFGGGGTDLWLVKLNSMGSEEWNKTFGGVPDDWGGSVYQTEDGGFIITGDTKTYTSGGFDYWLIKTDSAGNEEWNKTFGRSNADDTGHSVKQTSDGGYIILGVSTVFSSDTDIWLVKTDDMGNEEWNRYFGGPAEDWAFSINETSDGAYVIVGDTSSYGSGLNDVWLLKWAPLVNLYGELYSTNLLSAVTVSSIDSFSATTFIPPNTEIQIQFSQDGITWYDSMGAPGAWDSLLNGPNTIDVSALGWSGSNFYYRANFSTIFGAIPILDYVNVSYNGYVSYGIFTSQAFDCGSTNVSWKMLSWMEPNLAGADIQFQLRTADIQANLSLKSFVGPDGTSGTFYSSSPLGISSIHNGEPWIQYRAYLSTTGLNAPILEEVNIYYNFNPYDPVLIIPSNDTWVNSPTPFFNWSFSDSDGTHGGFQVLIDDDMGFSSVDFDSGMQISSDAQWQFPNGTGYSQIPDGVWFWKVRVQDNDGDWSQYSLPYKMKIDSAPPTSSISAPVNSSYLSSLSSISGTAFDVNASGLSDVGISIRRNSDNQFWDGLLWVPSEVFLPVSGSTSWSKTTGLPGWDSGKNYTIRSQATDNASNIEIAGDEITFYFDSDNPWSTILVPADGSYHNNLTEILGTSSDAQGGLVDYVEITIKRFSDNLFWNGTGWNASETWLFASGTTSWSLNSGIPLWENDKIYIIRSKATDLALNSESPGFGNVFTYDILAPPPPFPVTSSPAGWTYNNSFKINWTDPSDTSGAVPGAYYKFNSPPTSDTDGIWVDEKPLTNISVPSEGAHTIYIWLKDSVGNVNYLNYSSTALYFDSQIFAPQNLTAQPSGWTKSNSFSINWVDYNETSGIEGAYYKFNSPPTSDSDGTWSQARPIIGVSVPYEGMHTMYLWLLDNAGNIDYLSYATTTLSFDSQDPLPPLDLASNPLGWTNINSFNVSWTNPPDASGPKGAYYKLDIPPLNDIDGDYVVGDDIDTIFDIAVGSEGEHIIYIWLEDKAGNVNYLNYTTTILYYDSIIDKPKSVETDPLEWGHINSFNITWINPNEDSGISGAYYKLYSPPTSDTDGDYISGDNIELIPGLSVSSPGEHEVYLWLVDYAGNVNYTHNETTTISYDPTEPEKPLNLQVTPDWSNDNSFTINWDFPTGSSPSGYKIGLWYKMGSAPENNEDGTWIAGKPISLTSPSQGAYPVFIWLENNAGNTSYLQSEEIQLKWDTEDPTLTITAPSSGEYFSEREVNLTWDADDLHSFIANIKLKLDDAPYIDLGAVDSHMFSGLTNGRHTVYLKAIDAAGNFNETSIVFSIDTIPPTVIILEPSVNESFETRSVFVSWWGVDSGSGIDHYEISLDNGTFLHVGDDRNHTFSNLSNGIHAVVIRGFDEGGTWADVEIEFIIDVYVVPDTDSDGLNDTVDTDDDNDGLPDSWEDLHGLDRLNSSDSEIDSDSDGLNNSMEFALGTDPTNSDSDYDGHLDGEDAYPLDSDKWKKEGAEEESSLGLILIVVVIVVAAVLFLYLMQRSRSGFIGFEEDEEEGFECPACGEEFSEEVSECPTCGAEFEDLEEDLEEDSEDDEYEEEEGDAEEDEDEEEDYEDEDSQEERFEDLEALKPAVDNLIEPEE